MSKRIRKAVFPVAGLGTRFLPATKNTPKEMLPIVDKPLVQYAAEEAIAAGCDELIFVTSSSKRAIIADHFDKNYELEAELERRGKSGLLAMVRGVVPEGVACVYVRQPEALGLGHAVLCAAPVVERDPFAVLLADDLIDGGARSCLEQMVDVYERHGGSVIAVEEVDPADTEKYGIVQVEPVDERVGRIRAIVEKPRPEEAPSNLAVVGRYILSPRIMQLLRETPRGAGGEIQLTDAIARLLSEEPVYAYRFEGRRYDCGSKLGYLEANVDFALKHPELGAPFRALLRARCGGGGEVRTPVAAPGMAAGGRRGG
ncbi:MAG TPA: UTP--glucose-1-phosphate uridylyltransferase GalU [Chromatiales bacterium]|nr:UTP--glucose-1-phosphate uridylyltransferase GalU [Chromatiales bacterium]